MGIRQVQTLIGRPKPILYFQPADSLELFCIVRYQDAVSSESVRGNEHVIRSDGSASDFKFCAQCSVMPIGIGHQCQDLDHFQNLFDPGG